MNFAPKIEKHADLRLTANNLYCPPPKTMAKEGLTLHE